MSWHCSTTSQLEKTTVAKLLERYSGMSVLVVDDNTSNVALLRALLEDEGLHRVHTETDSREVSRLLAEQNPDLVLLDLHMPHLDGHQVLRQIKRFAAGSYLPVIVLTADTTTDARDRALSQGAQDFLTKPLDTKEAALRIANLLETRELYITLRGTAAHSTTRQEISEGETRTRIEETLRDRAITPVYQPIVDVTTLAVVGYEGLSRFPDPTYGGPDRWFADASTVGLGVDLEWLAATMLLPILDTLEPEVFLAVNLSPAAILHISDNQLCQPKYCPRIVIEMTEHVPVEDYPAVHRALSEMRDHGARLAADDLGAGYAGFRHLLDLDPDIIKLDISLVRGIHHSGRQQSLIRAMTAFAADVGATVIAEGVEEPKELEALKALSVPWAQGYYLGRPGPLHPVSEPAS
jgi:EAL domain-containing protein (putative c-di-GMP-specific phosphodiesterase class I)